MSSDAELAGAALARAVDAAVAAVPGVIRLYPADAAIVRSAHRVLGLESAAPRSVVTDADGVRQLLVAIGLDADADAAEVGRRVAATVRGVAGDDARVRVRVSRVSRAPR